MVIEKLDTEFKMFMRWRGINIDNNLFELRFNEPQNFASYRQAEVDAARINSFTSLEQYPYLSKRFLMTRFLGLSEEEMADNERMWAEEQGDTETAPSEPAGLRSVGVTPGGIEADLTGLPGEGAEGMPGEGPAAGGMEAGGAAAAPAAGAAPAPGL